MRLWAALLLGSLCAFTLARLAPGDPAMLALLEANQAADPAALGRLRGALGLDAAWPVQYLRWVWAALGGDFGNSYRGGGAVGPELARRLAVSLTLGAAALALAAALAFPLARHAATRPGGLADRAIDGVALLSQSIPIFWIGAVLLWWLAVRLGWSGMVAGGVAQRALLPLLLLAFAAFGPLAAIARAAWRATAQSAHLRAALARGEPPRRALARQGRRAALAALAAAIAAEGAFAAGGAAVLEALCGVPGIGAWAVEAARARDWPVLQAVLFAAIVWCALIQSAAGWARRRLDPRDAAL